MFTFSIIQELDRDLYHVRRTNRLSIYPQPLPLIKQDTLRGTSTRSWCEDNFQLKCKLNALLAHRTAHDRLPPVGCERIISRFIFIVQPKPKPNGSLQSSALQVVNPFRFTTERVIKIEEDINALIDYDSSARLQTAAAPRRKTVAHR